MVLSGIYFCELGEPHLYRVEYLESQEEKRFLGLSLEAGGLPAAVQSVEAAPWKT